MHITIAMRYDKQLAHLKFILPYRNANREWERETQKETESKKEEFHYGIE